MSDALVNSLVYGSPGLEWRSGTAEQEVLVLLLDEEEEEELVEWVRRYPSACPMALSAYNGEVYVPNL